MRKEEKNMVEQVTNNNISQFLSKSGAINVIEFYTKTCSHCKLLQKELEKLSEEEDCCVSFGKVDIEEEPSILKKYDVMSVPTLMFLKDGEMKEKLIGYQPKIIISEKIKQLK